MAKRKLPLLFRCNFLTPKCSSFMLPLSIRGMFFWLQKFLSLALVSMRCLLVFRLSFWWIIFEKTIFVSGEVLFAFSHNFLTLLSVLMFFVRSFVLAWTIRVSGWVFRVSSISSRISSLVAPGNLLTDTLLDFESPLLFILF